MIRSMRRPIIRLIRLKAALGIPGMLLALSLLLAGCFQDDRVAGGDDFPNSVETLGKEGAARSTDSADWNGYKQAPSTPPEMYDSTSVPDSAPEDSAGPQGKVGTASDGRILPGFEIAGAVRSVVSLFDPLTGLYRVARLQTLAGIEARDTTWYRLQLLPPAKNLVRISGVVTYAAGRTERFAFEDADGDSVLSARAGSANLARARFIVTYASGRTEERTITLAAGSDLSFAARGDNVLRALETVHRFGTDTVYRVSLRPVAPDTVVYDPQRDSGRVEVEQRVSALGVRTTLAYRAVVFADSTRNHAVRFRRVLETSAGITETVALGRDSAPDFAPRDTGYVRIAFTSTAEADTIASSVTHYRVVLSDTAGRFTGNRLFQIEREKTFRYGAAIGSRYRLIPSVPVRDGGSVGAGSVKLRVDLRLGGWIDLDGAAAPAGISGTWTNPAGETGTVHFDANGQIITVTSP